MSCLITSLQYFFDLPLPPPCTLYHPPLSPPHWGSNTTHLHMPGHLNLAYLSFSTKEATPTFSRITAFLILSLLVCPHIPLNIRILQHASSQQWVLNWPTLHFIQQGRSNNHSIELLVSKKNNHSIELIKLKRYHSIELTKFRWYHIITQDTKCKPPFHPCRSNGMCDIIVSVSTTLDYGPKILKKSPSQGYAKWQTLLTRPFHPPSHWIYTPNI